MKDSLEKGNSINEVNIPFDLFMYILHDRKRRFFEILTKSLKEPIGYLPAGSYTKETLPPDPSEVLDLLSEIGYKTPTSDDSSKSTHLGIKSREFIPFGWSGNQEIPNFFDFMNEKLGGKFVFKDVVNFIDTHFDFNYSPFSIGELNNIDPSKTTGSCKILAYAKLLGNQLSPRGVLDLFGEHYNSLFEEKNGEKVLKNGIDHPNIRALITHGLEGVKFESPPLTPKTKK